MHSDAGREYWVASGVSQWEGRHHRVTQGTGTAVCFPPHLLQCPPSAGSAEVRVSATVAACCAPAGKSPPQKPRKAAAAVRSLVPPRRTWIRHCGHLLRPAFPSLLRGPNHTLASSHPFAEWWREASLLQLLVLREAPELGAASDWTSLPRSSGADSGLPRASPALPARLRQGTSPRTSHSWSLTPAGTGAGRRARWRRALETDHHRRSPKQDAPRGGVRLLACSTHSRPG